MMVESIQDNSRMTLGMDMHKVYMVEATTSATGKVITSMGRASM
jgi:hypothetical protein